MRIIIFLIFSTVSLFSLEVSQNQGFCLGINDWQKVRPLIADTPHVEQPDLHHENFKNFSLITPSGIDVPVNFFDRSSDTLIIAAPALPAPKESMHVFAKMFPTYDVVVFDYRWCNHYESMLAKSILRANPIRELLLDEIEELETVVRYMFAMKDYKVKVGLGECYSCFHFAQLQAESMQDGLSPFTHLIFDSCWYSLRSFAERVCYDPYLPIRPQEGGAPGFLRGLSNGYVIKTLLASVVFMCMSDVSIDTYLSRLHIPVLFIHGLNDLYIPLEHFQKVWNATDPENRVVLFTPYRHSDNLGNKDIYRYIADTFISGTIENFERIFQ